LTGTLESPYEAGPMASPFFSAEEQRVFDAKLSEIVAHYPADRKSAAMLPALRLLQELKGWLSPDGMQLVAKALGVPPERAYEVATFYVMFHTEKPGRHVVDVCTNLSCSLWGAEDLLAHLESKLGLKAGTSNAKFTLRETECLASCGTAPCLQIDEVHHENLTRARVDALFEKLT
jgi:NADH-quinone oxidoreductase subunit E